MRAINKYLLFSLMIILLAGLCSCKQTVYSEKKLSDETIKKENVASGNEAFSANQGVVGVSIPKWEIQDDGYHNIPDVVAEGKATEVTRTLKAGLRNSPGYKRAKNLIVMVCEGLTQDLIDSSSSRYGEVLLSSFPLSGKTISRFSSSEGEILVDYLRNDLDKTMTGITSSGDVATNSMRRMTTDLGNDASDISVYGAQFNLNPSLVFVMGLGDFDTQFDPNEATYLNEVVKSHGKKVESFEEAISLYRNNNVQFVHASHNETGQVNKLFNIYKDENTMPSFRQETAFSLAWMNDKKDIDGFCLFLSYCSGSPLDDSGVQDFDEGVAVAVKYVLENPDTALLICGCPADGSEAEVCLFGLGKDVSVHNTLFECVSSLFD